MNLLKRLSIKSRMAVLVGIVLLLMIAGGINSMRGLSQAGHSIEVLHTQGMAHTARLGDIVALMNASHAELLLTLQHDPENAFSRMHSYPAQRHLDTVGKALKQLRSHWRSFVESELEAEEKAIAQQFDSSISHLESLVADFGNKVAAGDFSTANEMILESIGSVIVESGELARRLLDMQRAEGEAIFNAAESNYREHLVTVLITLAITVVSALLLAGLTIRSIGNAVQVLDNAATRLADGDLAARADYSGHDELADVARAFNVVAEKFSDTVLSVRQAVSQLATAAEQTSVVSGQTLQGVRSQQQETEQVATAIEEMNATVREVASNASSAAEAARSADDAANQGREVVQMTIDAIGRLAGEVENANDVIVQLREESEQIGGVLDVIRNIAEQTNLLALNAAIEAARAGEQGRGFAVVADEVRTLASRTQQSTEEIHQMISRLQNGAKAAVIAMESGRDQAQSGVEQAATAGSSLDAITAAVDRISAMNTQIASAVEEQSAVAEEINRNINNIGIVSTQNYDGSQQNAAAANELAELSKHLHELVSGFRA